MHIQKFKKGDRVIAVERIYNCGTTDMNFFVIEPPATMEKGDTGVVVYIERGLHRCLVQPDNIERIMYIWPSQLKLGPACKAEDNK